MSLRRVLGVRDLILIAAASVGPAFSLATTYGPMVVAGGSGAPLALLGVVILMIGIACGYRRLGMRFPNAGSSYTWVRMAFGRQAGAYAAWVLIVANVFATVATSVPAGAYTLSLLAPAAAANPLTDALVGTAWVLATGILVWSGLLPTARGANFLVLVELLILSAAAVAAFLMHPIAGAAALAPLPGSGGVIAAAVIGIWMIDGWEVSASTAEESATAADGPGWGGLGGLALSGVVLWIAMSAFLRVGTVAGFGDHEADAMAYVAGGLGGPIWRLLITVTVLVSLAASLQTTFVYLTRSFFAMGRDGLLPRVLGAIDRRGQPVAAIALLTVISMACTLGSGFSASVRDAFAMILSGTSVYLGLLFLMSGLAAVRLFATDRAARLDGAVLPGLASLGLVGLLGVSVLQSDPKIQLMLIGIGVVGLPLAAWRGRSRPPAV